MDTIKRHFKKTVKNWNKIVVVVEVNTFSNISSFIVFDP